MAFECGSCHNVQAVMQPQGVFTGVHILHKYTLTFNAYINTPLMFIFILAPNICQHCKSGHKFEALQSSPFTNTVDFQVAKIQEIQSQVI